MAPALLVVVIYAVVASRAAGPLFPAGISNSASSSPANKAPNASPEVMLATNETGSYIADDDPRVKDYAYVLDALEKRYRTGSRIGIANVLTDGQEMLAKKGVHETISELGWHLVDSTPEEHAGTVKLPEAAAAYIVLRTAGR